MIRTTAATHQSSEHFNNYEDERKRPRYGASHGSNVEWGLDIRHTVTDLALNGFHYKMCQLKSYHPPNENCCRKLHDLECGTYYNTNCKVKKRKFVPVLN
jgi:hypothetical protein